MSLFTKARDSVVDFVSGLFSNIRKAIKALFEASLNDLEAIGDDALAKVKGIVKAAVIAAESAGGTWHEKRDAALKVIIPQITALGISLLTTTIDTLISNTVAALGYAKKAQ